MRFLTAVIFATLASQPLAALACSDGDHAASASRHSAGRESAWIAGEVREVDVDESTITLRHAKIASLNMGPMDSMAFRAASPKVIGTAKPGDKVRFRVRLVDDQPVVTRLAAARP